MENKNDPAVEKHDSSITVREASDRERSIVWQQRWSWIAFYRMHALK